MEAIKADRYEDFVAIIDDGFDVDALFENGRTPLMAAASNHNARMVEYLLAHKASVRMQNANHADALYFAIAPDYSAWCNPAKDSDQIGTVKVLLKGGAPCLAMHLEHLLVAYDEEMIRVFSQHWRCAPDRNTVDKAIATAKSTYFYDGSIDGATLKENIRTLLSSI